MKEHFRKSFQTIFRDVKKSELVYWWILRIAMIVAYILTVTGVYGQGYKGSNPSIQILANLVGMFAYEIIQLFFPETSKFRLMSPRFQNITALGFFLGSFGGAFLNLYYALPMYDKILHATGTAEAVYIGYEYVCATQLKIKQVCSPRIASLASLGFGFVLASGWELFEFSYDQWFGGDAQHWDISRAIDQAGGIEKVFQMIPIKDMEIFAQRFPIMDTMEDIIMNFVGGLIMYVILIKFPYRHRGENGINEQIKAMTE